MGIAYVNGAFLDETTASVSIFDRGFLFADSVYEVTAVIDGVLLDYAGHFARLERSCAALGIVHGQTRAGLLAVHETLMQKNALTNGLIYLQITGGSAPRDFLMNRALTPTLVMFCTPKDLLAHPARAAGLRVITTEDTRWGRRDIKTTQLLSQSLAKTEAAAKGADDAWMTEDGFVTEGSSNNAYIVTKDGAIVTRPSSSKILSGITRAALLDCIDMCRSTLALATHLPDHLRLELRPFSVEEAYAASEAFISSAGALILPVVNIDGRAIGDEHRGPVTKALQRLYLERAGVMPREI